MACSRVRGSGSAKCSSARQNVTAPMKLADRITRRNSAALNVLVPCLRSETATLEANFTLYPA